MNTIVRAIDLGWGNTKYVTSSEGGHIRCSHFPSIAPFSADEGAGVSVGGNRRTVNVPVDGLFYEVGPDVNLAVDAFKARTFHDNYSDTQEYRALMAGALSYMNVDHIDLLVVGLPVSQFKTRRALLERAMTGDFAIGRKKSVTVRRVMAVPQPQGALLDYANTNGVELLKKGRGLVIDVGSRTFDWLVTREMGVITKMSHSSLRGVSDVLKAIAAKLGSQLKVEFNDLEQIDKALREGKPIRAYQKDYELKQYEPIIKKITGQAVSAMVQAMDSTHDIECIVLVGGGARLFRKAINQSFPRHEIHEVAQPLYANVRGFQLIGESFVRAKPDPFQPMPTPPDRGGPMVSAPEGQEEEA